MRARVKAAAWALVALGVFGLGVAQAQQAESRSQVPSRLVGPIDEHALVTLKGNVRNDVATAQDLGVVEDGLQLHLYLLLQRSPAQQADLDNLLARQQQPTAPEYHKWLTPKQFGARFGASPEDIAKLSSWLESHGFKVRGVLNNRSMIDFAATAGQVREAFHTELHYFDIRGGKHPANVQDPQIPVALSPLVAGIKGLSKIPALTYHTKMRSVSYDAQTHRWHTADTTSRVGPSPAFANPNGDLDVTPQDLYTIYNVNPVFTAKEYAANATVAVVEESDIEYGTVNSTTGVATGGDVATFRSLFGVPGTLNMHVYHGYGTVTCNDPGIDPDMTGEDGEASLDAEWINATAPSANEIFMSCDQNPDQGIFTSLPALIDNNLSDVMSMSYGESELNFVAADYTFQDTLFAQAATQGQSIFISAGDSGSDTNDQNTAGTATSGYNVNAFAAPTVTAAGGTDFADLYDALDGGSAQSTYWGATNSANYGNALSYVPETAWNDSCASSIYTSLASFTGAAFCASLTAIEIEASVVGGSGGISTHYAVPAWQTGISGYSNSKHALPDIAGFASNGFWGHALISCDSYDASTNCSSTSTFAESGGTSFVAPYMAGIAGLLVDYTGSRQGLLNPALYALGKAQFTAPATATACYSNGQTANAGVTTGLPAAACIFNDVTTSNNDVPCKAKSKDCYVDSGATYGMLSLNGSGSLSVAYPSKPGFDQVSGIGTVNVYNLITKWNTAFTSTTKLAASATSITSSQSTDLTATVTGGAPTGYLDTPPAVSGTAAFAAGSTALGNCTLSGGTCSLTVPGSAFEPGTNAVTATFTGSGTYPASTSTIVTVTLSEGPDITSQPASQTVTDGSTATFSVTATGTPTLTYVWQYLSGATWKAFGAGTGYNTATLTTFATTAAYNGLQFRVVVTDGDGLSATSNTAKLTVGPAIATQPLSQTVTDGSAAIFNVVAEGVATLSYQWQYLSGSTWKAFGAGTGYTTATLTTFATTAAYNGLQLRVVVTDGNGLTATSNTVKLTVGPAITTQPVSETVTDGTTATFSVVAAGVPTLTYQWQYLAGATWKAFGAGTGYTTAALTTFATTAAYNALQLRVVVTDGNGLTAVSNTVKLTVGPEITSQPASQTVTVGNTATFSVVAAGVPTLTYQWQYLNGSTWKAFGAGTGYTTATLTTFATTAAYNGLQLRVVVTDENGLATTSNTVTLTVQ